MQEYNAVVKHEGEWWYGWIEEIPGVNCQERSEAELMETLRWLSYAHAQTKAIVLNEKILPANATVYPEGVDAELTRLFQDIVVVDPAATIEKISEKKFLNVALCGLLSRYLTLDDSAWKTAVNDNVPAGTFDANWAAFETGKSLGTA